MGPFDDYPHRGRKPLGRPRDTTGACRSGYGLGLQRISGQQSCAYCGLSLVDNYHHWLLMSVDHVVPRGEAQRLGIPEALYEDAINLVLCCAGCNGFGNRYRCEATPQPGWSIDEFLALRDRTFADRFQRIGDRRAREEVFFASKPWKVSTSRSGLA